MSVYVCLYVLKLGWAKSLLVSNSVFAATLIVALLLLQRLHFGQDGVQFSCQSESECVFVCVCVCVSVWECEWVYFDEWGWWPSHLGLSVLRLTVRKDVLWKVFHKPENERLSSLGRWLKECGCGSLCAWCGKRKLWADGCYLYGCALLWVGKARMVSKWWNTLPKIVELSNKFPIDFSIHLCSTNKCIWFNSEFWPLSILFFQVE